MEITEMTMEDIQARMQAINEELKGECDIDALTAEFDALEARAAEIKETAEKRSALIQRITAGEEGSVVERHEEKEKIMEERKMTPDTVEYRDAYMKKLMGKQMTVEERAALTDAADIIPTETLNQIYGKLEENPLIRELDALRIPGYVQVPYAKTVNDASWIAIASASTDSADVVDSIALTAKKLIKTVEITADIQAMAIPAFQNWLVTKLAQKMEAAICAAVMNGAGSTTVPEGILHKVTGQTAITTMSVAEIAGLMGKVGPAYHSDAVFVMTPKTFFEKVVPLGNDVNGMLVMNGIDYRLMGHKVVLDANALCIAKGESTTANEHILFGSLRKGYVWNYGEGISIEADQSVAFRSGSTVYRAMALCDGAVADEDAFAWAKC